MSPLDRSPGRRAHFSRLDWLRWRASSRLDLLLYAAGWTVQRWRLRLRAPLRHEYWRLWNLVTRSRRVCPAYACDALIWHTRPLREIFVDDMCRQDCADNGACWCGLDADPRPDTRPADAAPEAGPVSIPLTGPAGTASADPPRPAEAVPLGSTRGGLPVIRAGGVLLPDRMRETPEPMGFRIPPYYLRWERQQAARRWLP